MNPATREATFAGLRFRVPEGFELAADTEETLVSPVPHFPPGREWFRSYRHPAGEHLSLFCWDGSPRDRGPMVAAERWTQKVDGRTAHVSFATTFFRRKQEVLVAHVEGPRHWRHLVYTSALDRMAFERLLAGMRFVPTE